MKEKFISAFTPNKQMDGKSVTTILIIWIVGVVIFWVTKGHGFIPNPLEVLGGFKTLLTDSKISFLENLYISTWFCLEAMFYAIAISLIFALLTVLPFFRPIAGFIAKARFLSTVGLTFLFAQLTADASSLKMSLLIFCVTVFLITSFLTIVSETKKEELDYARTLKMNEWETVWHVILIGKMDQYLEVIRHNFAIAWMMLAMIENLGRADGGIGVILTDQNKVFRLEIVYAIQITILFMGILLDWTLGFVRRVFCPYSIITLERK